MKAKLKVNIDLFSDDDTLLSSEPLTDMFIGKPNITATRNDTIIVPAAAADEQYDFQPGNGVEILYILTNNDITLKLNATTNVTVHAIKADRLVSTDTKYGVFLITGLNITTLYFSNAGPDSATVKIIGLSL